MTAKPETATAGGSARAVAPAKNGVAPRDFARPRRLSPARVRELAALLAGALPALERDLARTSGHAVTLALHEPGALGLAQREPGALGETDAASLLASLAEPLVVLRFRCTKTPAWLVWEPRAAAAAVEALLGARGATAEPRALTPVETRVATTFLGEIVRGIAGALGLQTGDAALVQDPSELGSWRDGGPDAEPWRLEVCLALTLGGAEPGVLRLYLPGVAAGAAPKVEPLPKTLPAHLERVEVELSACLTGCELSLDQLLALEEGDVIPLDARAGDPATLVVEGLALARARLGKHRGRLAVRIERVDVHGEVAA